jgi:hypothetical protein
LQRGGKLSGDQVLTGLARTEPELREKAEVVPPGITESFDHLEAAAKRVAESFSGDGGIAGAVDKVAKAIDGAADNIDKTLHPKEYQPGGSKFTGPVRPEDVPSAPKSLGEVFTSNKGDLLGRIVSYILGGKDSPNNGSGGANPFGAITDFTTKAVTNPTAIGNEDRTLPPLQGFKPPSLQGISPEAIKPAAPAPLGFDRTFDGLLIKQGAPGPSTAAPAPPEYIPPPSQDDQHQLERNRLQPPLQPLPQPSLQPSNTPVKFGEAEQPQQVASLSENFQQALQSVISALTKQPADLKQNGIPATGGIRGEGETGAAISKVADLGAAAEDAAAKLRGVETPATSDAMPVAHARDGGLIRHFDGGGHVRGEGTTTSDSIPAMLSDKEYVLNAKAVEREGVDKLNAINSGAAHFADGGSVATATNDESGNFISSDGRYYHYRNKAEKDAINGSIDKANADAQRQEAEQRKHTKKSEFVGSYDPTDTANQQYRKEDDTSYFAAGGLVGKGSSRPAAHFASGGLVGDSPAVSSFRSRLTARGFANGGIIDAPQFAMPEMPSLAPPAFAGGENAFSPALSVDRLNLLHPVTLNLPGGGSVGNVYAAPSAVKQLTAAAIDSQTFSTGKKPAWYGGQG